MGLVWECHSVPWESNLKYNDYNGSTYRRVYSLFVCFRKRMLTSLLFSFLSLVNWFDRKKAAVLTSEFREQTLEEGKIGKDVCEPDKNVWFTF